MRTAAIKPDVLVLAFFRFEHSYFEVFDIMPCANPKVISTQTRAVIQHLDKICPVQSVKKSTT